VPFAELETGIRMHYRDVGSGSPIVFVPGFAATLETWSYAVLDLAGRHRCVTLDLRGHGQSDKPLSAYSYEEMCGDLGALLARLDLRDVTLAGWSMGAAIGLKYVTDHDAEGRIARLAMIGAAAPRFVRTDAEPFGIGADDAAATLEGLRRSYPEAMAGFADANFHRTDLETTKAWLLSQWLDLPPYAAVPYYRTLTGSDLREHVERVAIPVVLFHGRHDTICDAGWIRYMATRIAGARVVWFEDSAHALMFEEPDRFSAELAAFAGAA